MANAVFPLFKNAILTAGTNTSLVIDTTANGVYAVMVSAAYVYSELHDFFNDITGVIGTEQRVTSPAVGLDVPGRFTGAPLTFPSVTGVIAVRGLVVYRKNTGASSTWRLVAFLDTKADGTPIDVMPNGGNLVFNWSENGIVGF